MRASIATKLSLYDFGRWMQLNPLHLAQVTLPPTTHIRGCGGSVFFQYDWQNADAISREALARAIFTAESNMEAALGYRLAPTWEVDEWTPTGDTPKPELVRLGHWTPRLFGQPVFAKQGWFISGGIRSASVIEAGAAVTYSDPDGDGFDELATITVTVDADQNPYELHVYYPGRDAAPEWEIRPITVSITGTTATITFPSYCAVQSALQESFNPEAINGQDMATAGLQTVDAYRVYNDPQTQATLMWEPTGTGCSCGGDSTCASCSYTVQTACLHLRDDPKNSIVVYTPATWDEDELEFVNAPMAMARQPDLVRLFYYSGYRDKRLSDTTIMDNQLQEAVACYAAALLDRPPCDCMATTWEHWREDLALTQGSDGSGQQKGFYATTQRVLDCPFGTRRGAVMAWNYVTREARGTAVLAL